MNPALVPTIDVNSETGLLASIFRVRDLLA